MAESGSINVKQAPKYIIDRPKKIVLLCASLITLIIGGGASWWLFSVDLNPKSDQACGSVKGCTRIDDQAPSIESMIQNLRDSELADSVKLAAIKAEDVEKNDKYDTDQHNGLVAQIDREDELAKAKALQEAKDSKDRQRQLSMRPTQTQRSKPTQSDQSYIEPKRYTEPNQYQEPEPQPYSRQRSYQEQKSEYPAQPTIETKSTKRPATKLQKLKEKVATLEQNGVISSKTHNELGRERSRLQTKQPQDRSATQEYIPIPRPDLAPRPKSIQTQEPIKSETISESNSARRPLPPNTSDSIQRNPDWRETPERQPAAVEPAVTQNQSPIESRQPIEPIRAVEPITPEPITEPTITQTPVEQSTRAEPQTQTPVQDDQTTAPPPPRLR